MLKIFRFSESSIIVEPIYPNNVTIYAVSAVVLLETVAFLIFIVRKWQFRLTTGKDKAIPEKPLI